MQQGIGEWSEDRFDGKIIHRQHQRPLVRRIQVASRIGRREDKIQYECSAG